MKISLYLAALTLLLNACSASIGTPPTSTTYATPAATTTYSTPSTTTVRSY